MKRHRRTNVFAVFCALTSVFLILHGCGGGGDGVGGGPVAVTYGISGHATLTGSGLSGVTMALSGKSSGNAITDASGNYAFTGLDNGSYNITPSKTGFTFSPTSNSQTVSGANITAVNFVGTPVQAATYSISGQVTSNGSGLSGVGVVLSGAISATAETDASGNYTFIGLANGSYNITPSRTGFTFSPTSILQTVSGVNIIGVNFIATSIAPAFSQADVAGQWDALFFSTGVTSGWAHGFVIIDNTGQWESMANFANSSGSTEPTPGSTTWTVDSTGIISASANGVVNTFAGHMSSDKKLIVGVTGFNNGVSDRLTVLRKRTGIAFSSADLANKTFVYHDLFSGTDNNSGHGTGTIDSSGLTVDSTGIMTVSSEPAFYGVVTDDKKVIFYVNSFGAQEYEFGVITITGQAYTQADLAGVRYYNTINSATTNPGWSWGSISIDATGAGNYPTYKDSANGATPGPFTRILSATGVVTDPASPTYHGQLSYNKDLTVRTGTNAIGKSQIAISIE